ncbi:MAG: hypothetical protein CMD35_00655 [Flavobacteriales bacterium]|nr:hypothetical protein [Flavobacteriales bacterium]
MIFLLAVVFCLHAGFKYFVGEPIFSNRIVESYVLNFCLGYASFIVLMLSLKKHINSLGFIFMYTSFFKFVVFYLLFKSYFNSDGEIDGGEFLTLIIPYAFALFGEIFTMSRVLKE